MIGKLKRDWKYTGAALSAPLREEMSQTMKPHESVAAFMEKAVRNEVIRRRLFNK